MGVMTCHISNCTNIMCDTYVDDIGYVCTDCQARFKEWLKTQSPLYLGSEQSIIEKLKEFQQIDVPNNYEEYTDLTIVNDLFRKSTH